jgi:SMI1 / KNR4 family (SUKH-1)
MKIKLRNGEPASEEAILTLEAALGCPLSHSFRAFVRAHDGAKPETNIFKISDNNNSGVNDFIPVSEILKARARIKNIRRRAYPIAWAECGNYVVVDEDRNGAVFFGDHELPDEPTQLAGSFGAS